MSKLQEAGSIFTSGLPDVHNADDVVLHTDVKAVNRDSEAVILHFSHAKVNSARALVKNDYNSTTSRFNENNILHLKQPGFENLLTLPIVSLDHSFETLLSKYDSVTDALDVPVVEESTIGAV